MCNCNEQQEHKGKPHPHAALIKAWADGAVIQYKSGGDWLDADFAPSWNGEYRIKPEQTDLEKYGVEVGDVWYTHRDQIITVRDRIPLPCGVITLSTRSYVDNKHLKTLMFRRGVVNKL